MDAPTFNGQPGACRYDDENYADGPRERRSEPLDRCENALCGLPLDRKYRQVHVGRRVYLVCDERCEADLLASLDDSQMRAEQ